MTASARRCIIEDVITSGILPHWVVVVLTAEGLKDHDATLGWVRRNPNACTALDAAYALGGVRAGLDAYETMKGGTPRPWEC